MRYGNHGISDVAGIPVLKYELTRKNIVFSSVDDSSECLI